MQSPPRGIRLAVVVAPMIALVAGCRPAPTPVVAPPPAAPIVDTTPVPPPAPPPDTMVSYRVPPFREGPLVTWGAVPPGDERVPRVRTFDLQHQVVRVRFDWMRRAVVGSTTLRVAPLADSLPVQAVVLDAAGMAIGGVRSASGATLRHEYDGRTLTVHLAAPIRGRTSATFTIDYESERPAKGAYFSRPRRIVWTQGEPQDTRFWVPTVDQPGERSTWEIVVRAPAREMVLSNGRLIASRRAGAETEWHWRLDTPAPVFLMSVVQGDYAVLQDRWRAVPLDYWTYPDSVAAAWRAFGKTPRMLDWLAARTGIAFPWNKYDQAVVPDVIHGGGANVTAATMSDDAMLHPSWAEPHVHGATEGVVMHELAHQWFGSYVTVRDWSHVWLQEGFARMLEAAWREADHGQDEAEWARLVTRDAAVAADLRARRPLVWARWVDDPIELLSTGHVDARGAAVLELLRAAVGDSAFWTGVRSYLDTHRLAAVDTDHLRAAIASAAGTDLRRFFDTWVRGAGFPAFQVSFQYDSAGRELTLEARQVQPRDALTGWFEADIVVEVVTDSGVVRGVVASRDSIARLALALRAPPRAMIWDRDARLLHVTDFPRSTVMLAYQLAHARTLPGRVEALRLLAERLHEPKAVTALARSMREDAFWAVRVHSAFALAQLADVPADSAAADTVASSLLGGVADADPRVREAAVSALGPFGARMLLGDTLRKASTDRIVDRLDTVAADDPSRYVRAAAVRSLSRLDPARALHRARAMLAREGWLDLERQAALDALAIVRTTDAWELARGELAARRPATRSAAITALVAFGPARAGASAIAILPLLEDDAASVRASAAAALGLLGDVAAVGALESRALREDDPMARRAIDAALERLRSGSREPPRPLSTAPAS